jgi:hypothetical protein
VVLDRAHTEVYPGTDVGIGQSLGDEYQHIAFPIGQLCDAISGLRTGARIQMSRDKHNATTTQPGLTELFQWYCPHPDTNLDPRLTLRANLALPPETLENTTKKLDHVTTALAKPDIVITTNQLKAPVSP